MGLFDFLRSPPPAKAAPQPAEPMWLLKPPLVTSMEVATRLMGAPDDARVASVHAAIESALATTFGDQQPACWSRTPAASLAAVRAYRVDGELPCFHYLGWGLTEMGPKVSPNPAVSGFGIELSLKVEALAAERTALDAPVWPVELLARLAASIQHARRPFAHTDWVEAGAVGFGPENVRHLGCVFDSIPAVETPNGPFQYLQLFTIDDTELAQCKAANESGAPGPVFSARTGAQLIIRRKRPA